MKSKNFKLVGLHMSPFTLPFKTKESKSEKAWYFRRENLLFVLINPSVWLVNIHEWSTFKDG